MTFLNAEVEKQVRTAFAALAEPVKLVMYTQGEGGAIECQLCSETHQLVEEVVALSDKVSLEVRDFVKDADLAAAQGIDKIPAIAILADGPQPRDYGVRFYGIPSGYEFGSLIESIILVSHGQSELKPKTIEDLKRLTKPVNIQVYVTPTCPYCPRAVMLAHRLALASDLVTSSMVEATEFPHLSNKYQVYGVPRTVINEVVHVEGAVPEVQLVNKLLTVMNDEEMAKLNTFWQAEWS